MSLVSPQNSKSPASASEAPGRGDGTNQPVTRKDQVPMAISVQGDGMLVPVTNGAYLAIEVKPVNISALAACVNSFFTGEALTDTDEITRFELIVAAIYSHGLEEGMALGAPGGVQVIGTFLSDDADGAR
jgi:hypothetical protein